MSRVADGLSRFFGRVEIFARGVDEERRAAEEALARGHLLEARSHARALLARVPKSPLGLALLADAAEALGFHDECRDVLEELAEQAPWRQEVWLRLGLATVRSGADLTEALERAAAGEDPAIVRAALLALADHDIEQGAHARATRWIGRIPQHPSHPDPALALRRAECAWTLGHDEDAQRELEIARDVDLDAPVPLGDNAPPIAGRLRLLEAQVAQAHPEESHGGQPLRLAVGALLLDAPRAADLVAELLADCRDAALVSEVRRALETLAIPSSPRWEASFALAEGRRDDARQALLAAVKTGDDDAARLLWRHALLWRDSEALRRLAETIPDVLDAPSSRLLRALELLDADQSQQALDALHRSMPPSSHPAHPWWEALVEGILDAWVPATGRAQWERVWAQLRHAGSELGIDQPRIADLEREEGRPLLVTVVGEFNAGKSTFLNALLGTDVAPTGIRPTTATLHWVAWAPDRYARVEVDGGPDRIVSHEALKATLEELRAAGDAAGKVSIFAPIPRLEQLEIVDTPGFNAPDGSHAEHARQGLEEAHVALWLLDGNAPLKDSERQVLDGVVQAGVPVQVLVNKRDRVGEDAIGEVLAYVVNSLEAIGVTSLAPPRAFSARAALAEQLGEGDGPSWWEDVETLIQTHLVGERDALRERALRRKTAALVRELAEASADRTEAAREREQHRRATHEARRRLLAEWRGNRGRTLDAILQALEGPAAALHDDARPLLQLDDVRRAKPEVRRYLVERTLAHFVSPVLGVLRERAARREADVDAIGVATATRSALAGAAAATHGVLEGDDLRAALEAVVDGAAELLEEALFSDEASGETMALGPRLEGLRGRLERGILPSVSDR